jgi:hypothetical protein
MFKINVSENRKAIKNEQFRDTGNIGYTRQRMKTNKTKKNNTAQKSKAMSNPTRTHPRHQG